jgi:CO/xanthine dehydrogenase FAD-binding subunit
MDRPVYLAPGSLDDALEILGKHTTGVKIIAGGTDLIPRMRSGIIKPALLVDLRLLALDRIELKGDFVHIGAGVTHAAIVESGSLFIRYSSLVEAAKAIAGPPVRNRGTIGGNLVNASPAADLASPLLVYDAYLVLAKKSSKREVPLTEFFIGPGQTVLAPDEILTEIRIPKMPANSASKFIKLGKRNAMAISIVNVATRLTMDENGKISQARIALGSVFPTPMRAVNTECALEGEAPSLEIFTEAGHLASAESSPISDIRAGADYRKKMAAVLTRRALVATWEQLEKVE